MAAQGFRRKAASQIFALAIDSRVLDYNPALSVRVPQRAPQSHRRALTSEEQQWIELNATKNEITIRPLHVGQEVLIVIGEELQEEKIKSYLKI